ncbi:MAG: hypothetical protein BZ136_09520 [Methanosphaera sp. rholeuAM74]|nr:MAG: hypothetical protein BZ136_09520 [Methanosphaera sp. rholeuAM74]
MKNEFITVEKLARIIHDYRHDEHLDKKDNKDDLIKAITVEAGELLECILFRGEVYDWEYRLQQDSIQKELADILIYCFSLAHHMKWDVEKIIRDKIRYNKERGREY